MAEHNTLTGSALHEPKGADAAAAGEVYVADGATSGTFQKLTSASMDATALFNVNKGLITVTFTDIGAAKTIYIPMPANVTITKVSTAIDAALTTADAVLTVKNGSGTSMGTITITQSGSAAGDVDSLTPGSNNTMTDGQTLRIESDGGPANTPNAIIVIEYTQTGAF